MKKHLLMTSAVAVVMAFTACSKKDDDKGSSQPGSAVPEKLGPAEIIQGKPLSDQDIAQIKRQFGKMNVTPETSLLLFSPNESETNRQERLKKIADLIGRKKELYQNMKANCQVQYDESNPSINNPIVGQSYLGSKRASLTGTKCLMDAREDSDSNIKVTSSNLSEIQEQLKNAKTQDEVDAILKRYLVQMDTEARMKNTQSHGLELQTETGVSNIEMDISMRGSTDITYTDARSYVKGDGSVQLRFTSGEIVNGHIQLEQLSGKDQKDGRMTLSFNLSVGTVTIQCLQKNSVSDYYLNGRKSSQKEIEDIFGGMNLSLN